VLLAACLAGSLAVAALIFAACYFFGGVQ
jgi:hypothetical protein